MGIGIEIGGEGVLIWRWRGSYKGKA